MAYTREHKTRYWRKKTVQNGEGGRQGNMKESSDPRGLGSMDAGSHDMMFSCMDRAHEAQHLDTGETPLRLKT